jgi:hypothetical protein
MEIRKRIVINTKADGSPRAWIDLANLNTGKIYADIWCNYGDYEFDGRIRNNTAHERLVIQSTNMSYAKKKARRFFDQNF